MFKGIPSWDLNGGLLGKCKLQAFYPVCVYTNKKKELVIREYWENLVSIRSNGFVVKTEIKRYGRVFVVFMVFDYRMV